MSDTCRYVHIVANKRINAGEKPACFSKEFFNRQFFLSSVSISCAISFSIVIIELIREGKMRHDNTIFFSYCYLTKTLFRLAFLLLLLFSLSRSLSLLDYFRIITTALTCIIIFIENEDVHLIIFSFIIVLFTIRSSFQD